MYTLTPAEAIALVRRNLDELDPNGSAMYGPGEDEGGDNNSLDRTIDRLLPDAINAVHLAAPVQLLEGAGHDFGDGDAVSVSEDGVLSVDLGGGCRYLRLVAFRASDSPVTLTDTIPEASAEGRKQLNRYIRGTFDRPRLVILQGGHTGPRLRYYTLADPSLWEEDPQAAVAALSYVQEQFHTEGEGGYPVSRRLRRNIVDQLTAMAMEAFSDQRAQAFFEKASNFPTS